MEISEIKKETEKTAKNSERKKEIAKTTKNSGTKKEIKKTTKDSGIKKSDKNKQTDREITENADKNRSDRKREKHATIPIFVPHLACPNQCVFCNQEKISGTKTPPENISKFLENAANGLRGRFSSVDIAFFGGSFTGIEPERMISYLSQAKNFSASRPEITGIRLSTRPDYINREILELLKEYGVTAIELGCQSFDDNILEKTKRGHTSKDTENASRLIKEYGFELVLQLMPGLPGDTEESIRKTMTKTLDLAPDGVRIYPCVVISGTPLEKMYLNGEFKPLSTEEAVEIAAQYIPLFESKNIKVIKTGLHSSDLSQNEGVVAGPYHPAFGELVRQKIYLNKAEAELREMNIEGKKTGIILVSIGNISKMTENKKSNLKTLFEKTGVCFSVKEDDSLRQDEIKIIL